MKWLGEMIAGNVNDEMIAGNVNEGNASVLDLTRYGWGRLNTVHWRNSFLLSNQPSNCV